MMNYDEEDRLVEVKEIKEHLFRQRDNHDALLFRMENYADILSSLVETVNRFSLSAIPNDILEGLVERIPLE